MHMAYCVANFAKAKRADLRGLQAEAMREMTDEERYKNAVDLSQSAGNVAFVKSGDWLASAEDEMRARGIDPSTLRSDATWGVTGVYSASPEWFETREGETFEEREQRVLDYFAECLRFESRHGVVVSAVVHYDETTPHMHTLTVPVVKVPAYEYRYEMTRDEDGNEVPVLDKRGRKKQVKRPKLDPTTGEPVYRWTLSAKEVLGNRKQLSKMQDEFAEQVGARFGLERGERRVLDAERSRKHLDEVAYKVEKAREEVRSIEEQRERETEALERIKAEKATAAATLKASAEDTPRDMADFALMALGSDPTAPKQAIEAVRAYLRSNAAHVDEVASRQLYGFYAEARAAREAVKRPQTPSETIEAPTSHETPQKAAERPQTASKPHRARISFEDAAEGRRMTAQDRKKFVRESIKGASSRYDEAKRRLGTDYAPSPYSGDDFSL